MLSTSNNTFFILFQSFWLTYFISRYNLSLVLLFLRTVFADSWKMKWTVSSSLTLIQPAVLPAVLAYLGILEGGGGEEGGDVLSNMILQKLTQEHGNEKIPSDSKEAN